MKNSLHQKAEVNHCLSVSSPKRMHQLASCLAGHMAKAWIRGS